MNLRLVHWNVAHATKKGLTSLRDHAEMMRALVECFDPQVIVLTEYVESVKRHNIVCDSLIAKGFEQRNIHVSKHDRGTNGVLIATRFPSDPNPAPPTFELNKQRNHAASNYLHVSILSPVSIELVGFRREIDPSYTVDHVRRYWDWFEANMKAIASSRVIALGDFNLDPGSQQKQSRLVKARFQASTWRFATPSVPAPSGEVEWSQWGQLKTDDNPSTSRLDHALLSPAFENPNARYVAVAMDLSGKRCVFGGPLRIGGEALSDHAVLVLDIDA